MANRTARKSTTTSRNAAVVSAGDTAPAVEDEASEVGNSFDSANSSRLTRSRLHEKERLSGLNDRLAGYIEKVRQLQQENDTLKTRIHHVETVERRERETKNNDFKIKLDELRTQVDDSRTEVRKAEVERARAAQESEREKNARHKAEKQLAETQAERDRLADRVSYLQNLNQSADAKRLQAERDLKEVKQELEAAFLQIDTLQKQLEDEVAIRQNAEAKLTAAFEDIELLKTQHSEELAELTIQRHTEVEHIQRNYQSQLNSQVKIEIETVRNEFADRMQEMRDELEQRSNARVQSAEEDAERARRQLVELREESSQLRRLRTDLEAENSNLKNSLEEIQKNLRETDGRLRMLQEKLRAKDEQIEKLHAENERQRADYLNLLEAKVQLDAELATYHELLKSEETRLHITTSENSGTRDALHVSFLDDKETNKQTKAWVDRASSFRSSNSAASPRRGVKRRRIEEDTFLNQTENTEQSYSVEEEATGDVVIAEVPLNGEFIRLENKGATDVKLNGYKLSAATPTSIVDYVFHSRQTIRAGKSLTIWTASAAPSSTQAGHLVLRNQKWPDDPIRQIKLTSSRAEGEETVATYTRKNSALGELADGEDRCCVM